MRVGKNVRHVPTEIPVRVGENVQHAQPRRTMIDPTTFTGILPKIAADRDRAMLDCLESMTMAISDRQQWDQIVEALFQYGQVFVGGNVFFAYLDGKLIGEDRFQHQITMAFGKPIAYLRG